MRPSLARVGVILVLTVLLVYGFVRLGTWQVHRRAWKLDLIHRVDTRVHATPVPAPGPAQWPQVSAARDEYLHVTATGTYLYDKDTQVQAVSDLGSGFWVLTPLRMSDGALVLVNRGFVPPEWKDTPASEAPGPVTVTGLVRMPEPGGGFLHKNDPAHNLWYSRDVQGIAAARGLGPVAPYFIDADGPGAPRAGTTPSHYPVGGLTVISFPNNHLMYSITWYALALMSAAAGIFVIRLELRGRQAK